MGSNLQSRVLHNNALRKHMGLAFFNICWNLTLAEGTKPRCCLFGRMLSGSLRGSRGTRAAPPGRSCTSLPSYGAASGLDRSFRHRREVGHGTELSSQASWQLGGTARTCSLSQPAQALRE